MTTMTEQRICGREGCEKSLAGKRSDAKWCARHARRREKPLLSKDCLECGVTFKTVSTRKKRCSALCNGRSFTARHPARIASQARALYWADPQEARRKDRARRAVRGSDPGYKAAYLARARESRRITRQERGREINAAARERYATDPEYRTRKIAAALSTNKRRRGTPEGRAALNRTGQRRRHLKASDILALPIDTLALYERDSGRCRYCERALTFPDSTIDHVLPFTQGGSSLPWNLATACRSCNASKGARTPQVWAKERGIELPSHWPEAIPQPALRVVTGASRACLECGRDISGSHHTRKRCADCSNTAKRDRGRRRDHSEGNPDCLRDPLADAHDHRRRGKHA